MKVHREQRLATRTVIDGAAQNLKVDVLDVDPVLKHSEKMSHVRVLLSLCGEKETIMFVL